MNLLAINLLTKMRRDLMDWRLGQIFVDLTDGYLPQPTLKFRPNHAEDRWWGHDDQLIKRAFGVFCSEGVEHTSDELPLQLCVLVEVWFYRVAGSPMGLVAPAGPISANVAVRWQVCLEAEAGHGCEMMIRAGAGEHTGAPAVRD
jgi:hypothetical protein